MTDVPLSKEPTTVFYVPDEDELSWKDRYRPATVADITEAMVETAAAVLVGRSVDRPEIPFDELMGDVRAALEAVFRGD